MNPVETTQPPLRSAGDSQFLQPSVLMMAQGDGAAKGPPALSSSPTIAALWHALRRRWPAALGLATLAAALTVGAVFLALPPKFLVAMRLRVAKQPGVDDGNHVIFTANMEALVKSPLVLNRALNEKTDDGREVKDLELVRTRGMGVTEWLEKALKTDYKLGPEVLRVTLPSDLPDDAAEVLNAMARAFLHEYGEMERSKKQARLSELRAKKASIEEQLRSLYNMRDKQFDSLKMKDKEAVTVQWQQWARKLDVAEAIRRNNEEELVKAENEIVVTQARLKNLDKQEIPDDVLVDLYAKDTSIQGFIKRLADMEEEIARVYREFNEPIATQKAVPLKQAKIDVRNQKEDREAQLRPGYEKAWRITYGKELKRQIEFAELKSQEYARHRERLLKEITDLEQKVKNAGPGGANLPPALQATETKIDLEKLALNQTALKMSEVELETPASRIWPLTKATVPIDKDRSQQTKIAGAGGLGMFVFVLFAVAFLEFRSRKISGADEVSSGLGIKVLGSVPALPGTPGKDAAVWQEHLHEAMDAIRTVLMHQARSEKLKVLMITSASRGEGKTTLATQLAASLARAWKRVLIIDGNVRHPATHLLFDAPSQPGLAEVLRSEVEPPDAVRATAFSRLWLLPAGNGDAHAIQALAQDNVGTLFEQLKQQYDFIIIDAPAVLPVTDSLLLGQHVDGVLFAILRDVSRAPAVHAAQQKLEPLGVPTLGAVMLGTDVEFGDKPYGFAKS